MPEDCSSGILKLPETLFPEIMVKKISEYFIQQHAFSLKMSYFTIMRTLLQQNCEEGVG